MRSIVFVLLIIGGAAGCATLQAAGTRSTEDVLSAAGFHREAADTPEKLADLQLPPARKVLSQTRDGKIVYVYRDPSVCHCLYVGGEPEYEQYQKLRLEQDIADEESNAALNWGWGPGWGSWSGWWGPWRQWP